MEYKKISMQYGNIVDTARCIGVSRSFIYYIKDRYEKGKPIRTLKGKMTIKALKKSKIIQ